MKIKISKTQWEDAGRKAGLLKKAQEESPIEANYIFKTDQVQIVDLSNNNQINFPSNQISDLIGQLQYIQNIKNNPRKT